MFPISVSSLKPLNAFGDSICDAYDLNGGVPPFTVFPLPFHRIVGNSLGFLSTKRGSGGPLSSWADVYVYRYLPEEHDNSIMLVGINDMRTFYNIDGAIDQWERELYALIYYLAIPANRKVLGQAATFQGTWSNSPDYSSTISKYSTENGAKATCSVKGSTIIIGTTRRLHGIAGGQFGLKIDGNSQTNIEMNGGPWNNDYVGLLEFSLQAVIISGLSDESHAIELTTISNGTALCQLDWVAGLPTTLDGHYARVMVANCIYFTTAGYAWAGGNDAAVDTYNAKTLEVCNAIKAKGLYIDHVDVCSHFNPNASGNMQYDGLHPTASGHVVIAQAILAHI